MHTYTHYLSIYMHNRIHANTLLSLLKLLPPLPAPTYPLLLSHSLPVQLWHLKFGPGVRFSAAVFLGALPPATGVNLAASMPRHVIHAPTLGHKEGCQREKAGRTGGSESIRSLLTLINSS